MALNPFEIGSRLNLNRKMFFLTIHRLSKVFKLIGIQSKMHRQVLVENRLNCEDLSKMFHTGTMDWYFC